MKRTGIFFPYLEGERLRDFPMALEGILEKENVFYYDARYEVMDGICYLKKMPEELLVEVHAREMVERVKKTGAFEGAVWSASGTVQASELIFEGKIDNAFVFTGYGDHHAGRNFYGGGCYFNSALSTIKIHQPELIFWNFGYDGTQGEYGDIGITKNCHPKIAKRFKGVADQVCNGRLITVLCGGHQRKIATYVIPKIIRTLAEID